MRFVLWMLVVMLIMSCDFRCGVSVCVMLCSICGFIVSMIVL